MVVERREQKLFFVRSLLKINDYCKYVHVTSGYGWTDCTDKAGVLISYRTTV